MQVAMYVHKYVMLGMNSSKRAAGGGEKGMKSCMFIGM
jgi:hypothetical protein